MKLTINPRRARNVRYRITVAEEGINVIVWPKGAVELDVMTIAG